jgi:hypothetical protein
MGVGLEGVLLTSHLYPFTQSMVPYSGDEDFCLSWSDRGVPLAIAGDSGYRWVRSPAEGVDEHGALRSRWSLRDRVAPLDRGFVPVG